PLLGGEGRGEGELTSPTNFQKVAAMIVIIGAIIVTASVLGGFAMAGGNIFALIQPAEFIVIGGSAFGALVIMSPRKVLIDMCKQSFATLKGSPYGRHT